MVGSLGETELAAVGISSQLFILEWMVLFGFTSGTTTYMAQFWGAGDLKSIRKTTGFAITVTLAVGSVFFILGMVFPKYVLRLYTDIPELIEMGIPYVRTASFGLLTAAFTVPFTAVLRATQQTKIPLYISACMFGTNTFLNYVFIFGNFGAPALGVKGAALATLIARLAELVLVVYVVFIRKNKVSGKWNEYFGWPKNFIRRVLRNAVPTTVNETFWGFGTSLFIAAYARMGITEYAAVQAGSVIASIFSMVGFSLGDAALILVGEKLGANKIDEGYELGKKLLKNIVGFGIILGVILMVSANSIVSLYDMTAEGKGYTVSILMVHGCFLWLVLFNGASIAGVLRAGGDAVFALTTEMGTIYLYAVPMAFIACLWLQVPVYMAVFLVKTEEIIKGVILFRRFISRKWARNVIGRIE